MLRPEYLPCHDEDTAAVSRCRCCSAGCHPRSFHTTVYRLAYNPIRMWSFCPSTINQLYNSPLKLTDVRHSLGIARLKWSWPAVSVIVSCDVHPTPLNFYITCLICKLQPKRRWNGFAVCIDEQLQSIDWITHVFSAIMLRPEYIMPCHDVHDEHALMRFRKIWFK